MPMAGGGVLSRKGRAYPGLMYLLVDRAQLRRPLCAMLSLALAACQLGLAAPIKGTVPQDAEESFVPAPRGVRATPWIEGLEVPWSLVFLPDGRALVSERPGRIRLISDGRLADRPYATFATADGSGADVASGFLSLFASGEGGLMGLAVHPRFPAEPYVYAMHTYKQTDGVANRVVRLRDEGGHGRFDRVILDGIPGRVFHNGGRIAFGPDGLLYITTGEAFDAGLAQDMSSLGGKILRLTPEGRVPADNPFPGSPVYSLGHRNPQGLAWHPRTGDLFASEHGPSGEVGFGAYDEINVIAPGRNYGWPLVVGAPGKPGLVDPLVVWKDDSVPPTGMTFHRGALYLGMLGSGAVIRLVLHGAGAETRVTAIERWFADGSDEGVLGRIRDVVSGPDGHLYVLTGNRDGRGTPRPGDDRIYRLEMAE